MESSQTSSVSADVQRIAELAQGAARHATELLRAEFVLAKHELRRDLQIAKRRALSLALCALLLEAGIAFTSLGVVWLWGATATAAFATGGVLSMLALGAGLYGVRAIHSQAVLTTRERLEDDAQRVAKAMP